MNGPRFFTAVAVAAVAAAMLAAPGSAARGKLPALAPAPADSLTRLLRTQELSPAEYALVRARALFRHDAVAARYGHVAEAGPRDATMILRDLYLRKQQLTGADRRAANAILARPTDGADSIHPWTASVGSRQVDCSSPFFCIHWVETTDDAPSLADTTPANGRPDWIDQTLAALNATRQSENVQDGWRTPRPDTTSGSHNGGNPDGKLDVYIADLGNDGIYGYCTSDDPSSNRAVSAYCVVDNDFSPTQFTSGATGVAALDVTVAHEYNHACQYAYDAADDPWIYEGSATMEEDEVFNGVNDNRQYLGTSPLGKYPYAPLDFFNSDYGTNAFAGWQYGTWIFFRFLSEDLKAGKKTLPTVMPQIWKNLTGSAYSTKAVAATLKAHSRSFGSEFAKFGRVNAAPKTYYLEGGAYRTPAVTKTYKLSSTRRSVGTKSVLMYHMSNDYYAFKGKGGSHIRLTVDPPNSGSGYYASALVFNSGGGLASSTTKALGSGAAKKLDVRFGGGRRVVLVLTNASTRFSCNKGTILSCAGVPRDDRKFTFGAKAHS